MLSVQWTRQVPPSRPGVVIVTPRKPLTPEQREAARLYAKAYYQANRDEIIAKNRLRTLAAKAADPEGHNAAHAEYSRNWRERNPVKRRAVWVRAKYGFTDEQVAAIDAARPDLCESCGIEPSKHIDHDHATGKFRGWLCAGCNQAAGLLRDDPTRARSLADYLVRSQSSEGNT